MAATASSSPLFAAQNINASVENKRLRAVRIVGGPFSIATQHSLCICSRSIEVSPYTQLRLLDSSGRAGQFGVTPFCHGLESQVETDELVNQLRSSVATLGGNSEDLDDTRLLQFLRSQSWNVEKAAGKVVSHQQWKAAFKPQGFICRSQIPDELAMGKSFLQGYTKRGHPLFVTLGSRHFPSSDFEQFKRFVVYSLDSAVSRAPREEPQFVCIVDLKGLGLKNLDANGFITAFSLLQDHYPGSLHKLFMVHVPLIFNGVWKVATPFLDQQTRDRIVFVPDKKLRETLLSEIDEDQLPVEYGGTGSLIPL